MDKPQRKMARYSKEVLEKKRAVIAENRKKRVELTLEDPKKQDFLKRYYEPTSPTYANAYRSAIDAGFSPSYAKVILSPSMGNKWVKIENYLDGSNMTPQHIIKSAEKIALQGNRESEQLKALEFLAKINGMLVDKKVVASVSIEDLLNEDGKPKSTPSDTPKDILDI